jgi:hypothetical protein
MIDSYSMGDQRNVLKKNWDEVAGRKEEENWKRWFSRNQTIQLERMEGRGC